VQIAAYRNLGCPANRSFSERLSGQPKPLPGLGRSRSHERRLVAHCHRLGPNSSRHKDIDHSGLRFFGQLATHQDAWPCRLGRSGLRLPARPPRLLHFPPEQSRVHIGVDLDAQAAVAFVLFQNTIAAHKALASGSQGTLDLHQPAGQRLALSASFFEQIGKSSLRHLPKGLGHRSLFGHHRIAIHDRSLGRDNPVARLRCPSWNGQDPCSANSQGRFFCKESIHGVTF
jgi:hypothetical protein